MLLNSFIEIKESGHICMRNPLGLCFIQSLDTMKICAGDVKRRGCFDSNLQRDADST